MNARSAATAGTLLTLILLAGDMRAGERAAAAPPLAEFLERHCSDCHQGDAAEAGVRLDTYREAADVSGDPETWERVARMLRSRQMPPEDVEQPSAEDRQAVVTWLDEQLRRIDCEGPVRPGRVTVRRLNRAEYTNTIRDLLGIEYQASDSFPADDVGYGFDNIGDVLTLPPLLMEKYLDAASEIADRAVVTDPLEAVARQAWAADELRGGGGGADARYLASSGEIHANRDFADAGQYLVRIRAYGDQAGDEPARMELRLDGKGIKTFEVAAVAGEPAEYEAKLAIDAGMHRIAAAFVNDYYNPQAASPDQRDRNLAVQQIEVLGPLDITPDKYPESHRRIFAAAEGQPPGSPEAARKIIERLVSRAYRRPAASGEVDRLVRLWGAATAGGESFESGIEWALEAILVSPQFLFRVERDPGPDDEDRVRELDPFELATRISYFLWSSMPDEELFEQARRGTLRANLDSQVRRMLADRRSEALIENFALQWLQLRHLDRVEPDRRQFRSFDDQLRADMLTEARLLFGHVLREDRSILELLDADYAFLNERLARHYGIDGVRGEEFRQVRLGSSPRGGVLTLAAVLTVTSNPTRTSAVKRGRWILDNILGEPPPDPPPGVPQLAEDRRAVQSGSLRERLEQHRADPNCAVCHRKMDALGFAMENFDPVGAWRTKDGPFAIDASGELPDGERFAGPDELKAVLLSSGRESFTRCLTEKMLTYALGRGLERYDRCATEAIAKNLSEHGYRLSALVLAIIRSDPFQKRGLDD